MADEQKITLSLAVVTRLGRISCYPTDSKDVRTEQERFEESEDFDCQDTINELRVVTFEADTDSDAVRVLRYLIMTDSEGCTGVDAAIFDLVQAAFDLGRKYPVSPTPVATPSAAVRSMSSRS